MSLRPTHRGYAYQDLVTGIALVDLVLGTVVEFVVDTKGFEGDRFDDLTMTYKSGRRVRLQIKHTTQDRELAMSTFSGDGRSLKLNLLLDSLLDDLSTEPDTTYRIVVRDGTPDEALGNVLKPVQSKNDPGDPIPGITSRRFRFDSGALIEDTAWKKLVEHLTADELHRACEHLTVDIAAPSSTLDFSDPGPAERVLLRRVTEELGVGRPPIAHLAPEYAALALTYAATSARAIDGRVLRGSLLPRIGLITDFGAVAEGHPIERAVAVPRADASLELAAHIDVVLPAGGRVILTGTPGSGKSWLCEELADRYRDADWIVARHHCWLGAADINRNERVLSEVVIGSLLRQLEEIVPEATASLRPRFAATNEALAAALNACRESLPDRPVLIIVDGLDHVDRVVGRRSNDRIDPSRRLVNELTAVGLPAGVCMLIASQPGAHLADIDIASGGLIQMPPMSRSEIGTLAKVHGLMNLLDNESQADANVERVIVDTIFQRSGGNALYATYLCRYATRVSPFDSGDSVSISANDITHRLALVPAAAEDVYAYYDYLLSELTADQLLAIGVLALCNFALSADELGELLPDAKPLIRPALVALSPVLNSQPGLGGLRVHHESFSRHILRNADEEWMALIRGRAAAWLSARGFFNDARAFRHLPELLASLERYDDLRFLVQPDFVAESIRAFQPPEALLSVISVVAREAEARLDWPMLITCVETRKAIDTYEKEALTDSLVEYADVVVAILGAEAISERLMYEGRPTFPARWGLLLCNAVDRAGAAAPWSAYIDAHDIESERDNTSYGVESEATLHLAIQLGALRKRGQQGEIPADIVINVGANLELDHDASLKDLVEVFTNGLPLGLMPAVAASMGDPVKAAQVYLAIADLAAAGTSGLPAHTNLARDAWTLAPDSDIDGFLRHGIPAEEILAALGISDLASELVAVTETTLDTPTAAEEPLRRWLSLVKLAHAIDRTIPMSATARLTGVGFYRAWMRFTVATVGIADDVADRTTTPQAASTAVLAALADLESEARPFTGRPRASDLYFVHSLIHETIENALRVVRPQDLEQALRHLIAIGKGTTTSTMGLAENGPLATNDLLEILSRVSDQIGIEAVYPVLRLIRNHRNDANSHYSVIADFELATARICQAASATAEAEECWDRACRLLAGYGGHKDPTLSEIIDSLEDLASVDVSAARACLGKLVDLVYLVRQHTDGRDTSHFVNAWWEVAVAVDPTAAANDAAVILLADVGFEDGRAHTAHATLLELKASTADPIVLAALRLTVGSTWRRPDVDQILLSRLRPQLGSSPQTDALLAVVSNQVAASYDDLSLMYSSDQPQSVVTPELVDAIVQLGGPEVEARKPRVDRNPQSSFATKTDPEVAALVKLLVKHQRPSIPPGAAGALTAARDFTSKQYDDDAGVPRWDMDALASVIGWRVIEETLLNGSEAGIELINGVARELPGHSGAEELFAVVGEALQIRCDGMSDALPKVASYCLALAYTRIRGGGGWRMFAGRERSTLWTAAYSLDPAVSERALAAAVVDAATSEAYRTFGVTQGVVAAFAAEATSPLALVALKCWEAAFLVIQNRLPGIAERGAHEYQPTINPDRAEALCEAMATLALATISKPLRDDIRSTLLAAELLLTAEPSIGQTALAQVLKSELDVGRIVWLLDAIHSHVSMDLTDPLAEELTSLAGSDRLAVRALAAEILFERDLPVPEPPATTPAPQIRAAFHDLVEGHVST